MKAADLTDHDAIAETLVHYCEGAREASAERMSRAFHPEARIYGLFGDHLLAGPIQELYDWHEDNGPAVDVQTQVSILEIAGTAAVIRIEAQNWTGLRFTDYMSMVKTDGTWKIVCKTFHHHAA